MIKKAFLEKYPEYNSKEFEIIVTDSQRFSPFGGDLIVKSESGCIYFWYEKDSEGNITFEEEVVYDNIRVDVSFRPNFFSRRIYFEQYRPNILEDYRKKFESKIRKELAEKILSGEIDLCFSETDSDCWECPPSKISDNLI